MIDVADFTDRLQNLARRALQMADNLETEEATKNALIMPFLHQVLGYDVFDPSEVLPEYTADTPGRKGEKVDYAILSAGEVQILIECKKYKEKLAIKHASQLFRYFTVSKARIGILTNGVVYEFYTDLDNKNVMDSIPFLTMNLADLDDHIIPEVMKLAKTAFDVEAVVSAAGELKYLNQMKKVLTEQFREPDEEFVRFLTSRVYGGVQTAKIRAQFMDISKKALKQFLNDSTNARLKFAIGDSDAVEAITPQSKKIENAEVVDAIDDDTTRIETTQEELEGYNIIRAILRGMFAVKRIAHRDTQSYFGILLDDNNRKPLCRLHFNTKQKYIGIIDDNKKETRYPIMTVDEIFDHADIIIENAKRFQ